MMTALHNKRVLITGASGGIGEAAAREFSRQGCHVLLAARRLDRVQALADELIAADGIEAKAIAMDVCDAAAVKQIIDELPAPWSAIDIVVNNAGLARGLAPFYDGDPGDWDEVIDTNIKGLLHVARAVTPGMLDRQSGHIINLGSIAGYQAYPNSAVYCATKFAVRGLTQGMKIDLHGTPLRVSEIAPGMVKTDFSNVRFKGDTQRADAVYQNINPLLAEDIAKTIVFCAQQPPHVDIMTMTILPTDQSSATLFNRTES